MDEIHQLKLIDKMGFLMAKRFPTRKAMGRGLIEDLYQFWKF